MPPKGGNAKKETGRAKKADNAASKAAAAADAEERKEAAQWADGSKEKNKKVASAEEKRAADLARKAENARRLAEEEEAAPAKISKAPKAGGKKAAAAPKPAGPGALAAGGGLGGSGPKDAPPPEEPESFAATGLDNALDLLDVVTSKTDKASVGQQAAGIEQHPERRFKAAFEAYKERELPDLKLEHPGLRMQQYNDVLYKKFQKSPDNPFNQVSIAHNATKEEKVEALSKRKQEVADRLRERS